MAAPSLITATPWQALKAFTDARIALGRAGNSLPTAAHLSFQLAHAQARDAVHVPFDAHGMAASLGSLGHATLMLHSQAADRTTYLQRPDLGRRLDAPSLAALSRWQAGQSAGASEGATDGVSALRFDLAFVVVDGLSPLAIHQNAVPLLSVMLERLQSDPACSWSIAPLSVVEQGRVAVGDEVGEHLRADIVVVLIGERPGLSSPDSLGVYITWAPQVGRTDAERNCISNVRPTGLPLAVAGQTLHTLLNQARVKRLTGVGLKDAADHQLADDAGAVPEAKRLSLWQGTAA